MRKKNPLTGLNNIVNKAEGAFCSIVLTLMLFLGMAQIIFRFLNNPIPWSESMLIYGFVWSSLVAASYGIGQGAHFKMDMLTANLSDKNKKYIYILVQLIILFFSCFLLYYGTQNAILAKRQMMYDLPYTMFVPKLAVPVAFGLSIVHCLHNILEIILGNNLIKENKEEEVAE